jgi:hypothetical protein
MKDFDEELKTAIHNRVLSQIKELPLIDRWAKGQSKSIPSDIIDKAWESIDWDLVVKTISKEMTTKVCNSIVGNLATEVGTDVKAIMSIPGVRQGLRAKAYPVIMKVIKENA